MKVTLILAASATIGAIIEEETWITMELEIYLTLLQMITTIIIH